MTFAMNKDQVVQVPKDTKLDGVVIDVDKTTWRQIISPDKIDSFKEPDTEIVVVKYETKFEDKTFKGEDSYNYYEKPMANSKLGMFLEKYTDLKAGVKIKVDYNSKGIPKILLE